MNDILWQMVMAIEGRDLLNAEQLAALDREVDRNIKQHGFTEVETVKQRMELPVQRLVKARAAAMEHLRQLARDGL
ncbi:hypothetical protein [Qipengyuania sediminis]|uniref:hypothetical protein n=1 Tax=Qipengyuania sediminis TaxID=1532023 RepID=UPI001059461D|nr:hypothetical protein [Qipengyuania sediminis]